MLDWKRDDRHEIAYTRDGRHEIVHHWYNWIGTFGRHPVKLKA